MITGKSQLQTGFIIADRIQFAYNGVAKGELTSTINAALLDTLGKEKYKEFCRKLQANEVPRQPTPQGSSAYFSEEYIDRAGWHEVTLFDSHVKYYWGLSIIMKTVLSILD